MSLNIAFMGFGAFGSGIAHYLDQKYADDPELDIRFWDIDSNIMEVVNDTNKHPYHFPDLTFSDRVRGFGDSDSELEEMLGDADYIFMAVKAQATREAAKKISPHVWLNANIINVSKGLEQGTHKLLSDVVREELQKNINGPRIAIFSGGTIAYDISHGVRLMATVASEDPLVSDMAAGLLHGDKLRIYENDDIISVQVAAALKNVVSLGVGICQGLGLEFGTTGGAFFPRAKYEIYKVAKQLGAKEKTFFPGSPSFDGDITLSCFGKTRNREYGERICAEGATPESVLQDMKREHKTVEGYYTVKAAYDLAKANGILKVVPIINEIYNVLYEGKDPKVAMSDLMKRERTYIRIDDR